jgi:hypothetical protein
LPHFGVFAASLGLPAGVDNKLSATQSSRGFLTGALPHDAHLESLSGERWSAEKAANGGRDAMPGTRVSEGARRSHVCPQQVRVATRGPQGCGGLQDGGTFRAELRTDCRRGTGSPNDGTRFKSAHKAGDLGIPMTLLSGGSVNINQGSQWGNPSERVNPQYFSLIHPRAAILRIVVRGN